MNGKITQIGGKRVLDEEGPWNLCTDSPEFTINFDEDGGEISVRYEKMEGDFDSRIEAESVYVGIMPLRSLFFQKWILNIKNDDLFKFVETIPEGDENKWKSYFKINLFL